MGRGSILLGRLPSEIYARVVQRQPTEGDPSKGLSRQARSGGGLPSPSFADASLVIPVLALLTSFQEGALP